MFTELYFLSEFKSINRFKIEIEVVMCLNFIGFIFNELKYPAVPWKMHLGVKILQPLQKFL